MFVMKVFAINAGKKNILNLKFTIGAKTMNKNEEALNGTGLKGRKGEGVKCMKKSDLVAGKHIVQYRVGEFRSVGKGNTLIDAKGRYMYTLNEYDEKLNNICGSKNFDIVAVYELNEVWKREELTITDDEKVILRNLPANYEWIARDKDSKLYIYLDKPERCGDVWIGKRGQRSLEALSHLFEMVKWEDDEPWKIEDLLKLDAKKDG